jgi:hypothetical protein
MHVYAFIYISLFLIQWYRNTEYKKNTSLLNINLPLNWQLWKSKKDKHIHNNNNNNNNNITSNNIAVYYVIIYMNKLKGITYILVQIYHLRSSNQSFQNRCI